MAADGLYTAAMARTGRADKKGEQSFLPALSPPEGAGWLDRTAPSHGENKEVFDAEQFAIHRAMGIFLGRRETGLNYTIFSDSTAAIERAMAGRYGPGRPSQRISSNQRSS